MTQMTSHEPLENMMQMDFSADATLSGFRLERLEVYNWGTFHNRIWNFALGGQNGLLTGDVGSGKSTLVDAITTLLIPSHKAAYNKAAGADQKERTLASYVQGFYKSSRSELGLGARPVALRDKSSYTVLLGEFKNRGFEQTLTLAQVFWLKNASTTPERFFIVADRSLTIREHFSGFGDNMATLKKRLKELSRVEPPFDSFSKYSAAYMRRLGLRNEQAMELFHQTVSMKSVGNLTDFVREHMLESFAVDERIDGLIQHFNNLNSAHDLVQKARRQIDKLTPLIGHLDKYEELQKEALDFRNKREGLGSFFARLTQHLLGKRLEALEGKYAKQTEKFERFTEEVRGFKQERDELSLQIAQNGGDRIENLRLKLQNLERVKNTRMQAAQEYNTIAQLLGMGVVTGVQNGSDVFAQNHTKLDTLLAHVAKDKQGLENEKVEVEVGIRSLQDECAVLENEIKSLQTRKNNIPFKQILLRQQMCNALTIEEAQIPFVGELLQIHPEQKKWEGAAERVLHNFALSLLVPERLYAQVSEWVNNTDLKGRIVYFRTRVNQGYAYQAQVHQDALCNKMQIKADTEFFEWLQYELQERFAYVCCDDIDSFRKQKLALTQSGQIKTAGGRHEKDDRNSIWDTSRYVMGWDNVEKVNSLTLQLQGIQKKGSEQFEARQQLDNRLKELDTQRQNALIMQHYRLYEELDFATPTLQIQNYQQELQQLEQSSNVLKELQQKRTGVDEQIQKTEQALRDCSQELGSLKEKKSQAHNQMKECQTTIDTASIVLNAEDIKKYKQLTELVLGERKTTVESSRNDEQKVREDLQRRIDAIDRAISTLRDTIIKKMQTYCTDYPAETAETDASLEASAEYRKMLDQLQADDLPRFQERFKELLRENAIREISQFTSHLNREEKEIKDRVQRINKSLIEIEYNPGRYIALEATAVHDGEIVGFKQSLRACMEGALGSVDDDTLLEQKFLQVKEIIERFKGREGLVDADKRWRRKVTDVRNWFDFAASERFLEDDSEYEHYTSSGGKSGGQKEKLAYTVLAASLAYQFGLEWEETRSRSFRFVVIDEAFGRGSDESARYGLELFKKLKLQLLIVTPLQKIHVIEPYVQCVGFVSAPEEKESLLRTLTIEEYYEEKQKHQNA
jgi:uncharacterized protein YPO0396